MTAHSEALERSGNGGIGGLLKAGEKDKLMKSHTVKDKKAKDGRERRRCVWRGRGGLGWGLCIITFSVLSSIGNQ